MNMNNKLLLKIDTVWAKKYTLCTILRTPSPKVRVILIGGHEVYMTSDDIKKYFIPVNSNHLILISELVLLKNKLISIDELLNA